MKGTVLNLRDLLDGLGLSRSRHPFLIATVLIAIFEVSFLLISAAQAILEYEFNIAPPLVVVGIWCLWTYWHSYLFPRHRLFYMNKYAQPYRVAFVRNIFPWVVLGFSQMWRPLINAENLHLVLSHADKFIYLISNPLRLTCGLTLSISALVMMVIAIRTIGIGNAAFLAEFKEQRDYKPIEEGVYKVFAHPLFWSGIVFSCALTITAPSRTSIYISAINIIYGVIYSRLENERLKHVFGHNYSIYAARVASLPGSPFISGILKRIRPRSSDTHDTWTKRD